MRQELKKYSDEAYEIVKHAANEIGPRLPGSEGEKKLHDYMATRLDEIGVKPTTEKFVFAPRSSIGGLPYAGWGGIIGAIALVLTSVICAIGGVNAFAGLALSFLTLVYMAGLWTWLVVSVFKYKTCFDWCFKHAVSHNTYGELLPKDGKYDYTIFVSGHTDTSWTLKLSASQGKAGFKSVVVRLALGAVSVAVVTVLAFVTFLLFCILDGTTDNNVWADTARGVGVMAYINVFTAPVWIVGAFLLTMYNEKTEAIASPGAMDNATGIAISYEVLKYFKENPDKMPKGCRIVDMNCGAEESGLRGSLAFVRKHKEDGMLQNAYHINVDSIADKDFFEVINGDTWLCKHFDKGLEDMFVDAMREAGIENPGRMANPVGGCDSTPFQKSGVKSITIAAQNPTMTDYYHTYMDVPERFDADTVGLGLDVVLRVIDKIAAVENAKGSSTKDTAPVLEAEIVESFEEVKE